MVFVDKQPEVLYKTVNGNIEYSRENGRIYESVKVERIEFDSDTGSEIGRKPLYTNKCTICCPSLTEQ